MNIYLAIPSIPKLLQIILLFKAPKNIFLIQNHFDDSLLELTIWYCRLIEMKLSLSVYSVHDLLWVKCSYHTLLACSEQDKCCLVVSVKAVLDLPLTLLVFLLFTCLSNTRIYSLLSDICFKHSNTYKESLGFSQNVALSTLYYMVNIRLFTEAKLNQAVGMWTLYLTWLYQYEWGFIEDILYRIR